MTVAKTCEKVLRCLRLKVEHVFYNKSEHFSFLNEKSYNETVIDFNFGRHYTIIDFNEVDIRIYLPEKVIIHRGR